MQAFDIRPTDFHAACTQESCLLQTNPLATALAGELDFPRLGKDHDLAFRAGLDLPRIPVDMVFVVGGSVDFLQLADLLFSQTDSRLPHTVHNPPRIVLFGWLPLP